MRMSACEVGSKAWICANNGSAIGAGLEDRLDLRDPKEVLIKTTSAENCQSIPRMYI